MTRRHLFVLTLVAVFATRELFALVALAQESVDRENQEQDATQEQEPPQPEQGSATDAAKGHFTRGIKHFRSHAYRKAIREFELAAELIPSADLWYNIARAHEELEELPEAIDYFQRYLRDRVDPPDRSQVEKHIASLKERLEAKRALLNKRPTQGELRVVNREKLIVDLRVDGKPIKEFGDPQPSTSESLSQGSVSVRLNPGDHLLSMERDGYIPVRSQVNVRLGERTVAYPALQEKTRYRAIRGKPRWTWVMGALAVGALAASVGLGIRAASLEDEEQDQYSRISDAMLGTGVVLGVSAAMLYFLERRSVGTERLSAEQK